MIAVIVGFIPVKKPIATPPKAAWDMPAPMNDILRSTTNTEIRPDIKLTMIPTNKAFCMNGELKISIISLLKLFSASHIYHRYLYVEEGLHFSRIVLSKRFHSGRRGDYPGSGMYS